MKKNNMGHMKWISTLNQDDLGRMKRLVKLAEDDKNFVESAGALQKAIPLTIFIG